MEQTDRNDVRGPAGTLRPLAQRFFDWRHLLTLGACGCLFLSLLFYLYISGTRALIAYAFFPLSLLLFGVLVWRERPLRYADVRLLLAAFLWMNASCLLNFTRVSPADMQPYYANACAVAFLCFPLAYAGCAEKRMRTFRVLSRLYIVPVFCSAVFALFLALSGRLLLRPSDGARLGLYAGRLNMLADPNMYGMLLCMALSLVLYLLLARAKPLVKTLLALMGLILLAALALTGCRSAMYGILPAVFFFAALPVHSFLRNRKRAVRLLVACAAGIALCGVLVMSCRGVVAGVNLLDRTAGSTAQSGGGKPVVSDRADRGLDTNARAELWQHVLGRLAEEKDVLVRGATPALAKELFISSDTPYNHFHNAYLGVLVSYGVPGLAILIAFLILLAVSSCRLLFSRRDLPCALRFVPVLLLPILAVNCMEEMLFTRSFVSELDVWLAIVSGYVFVLAREQRGGQRGSETQEQPGTAACSCDKA